MLPLAVRAYQFCGVLFASPHLVIKRVLTNFTPLCDGADAALCLCSRPEPHRIINAGAGGDGYGDEDDGCGGDDDRAGDVDDDGDEFENDDDDDK